MSESENKQQDQLERMLDKWGKQLPEVPAQLVTDTLNKIQVSHNPRRRNWFPAAVLSGMVAASLVVAVGLVVLVGNDKAANPATQVAAVAVATPTSEKAEVANPVNTVAPAAVAPVATSAPELSPAPTAVGDSTATAEAAQPTIELSGPTAATLGNADATPQPTAAPINTQAQPEAIPTHTAAAGPVVTTTTNHPTVAPVEPTVAPVSSQTKKPSGPIAVRPPDDNLPGTPTPASVQANPPGSVKLSGRIVTLEGSDLILSTDPEKIYFNSSTVVTLNGLVSTIGSLKVSQNVTIVATRNAQGQLVASSIAITPSGPKKG